MKICVTGGAGFIGHHVVRVLQQGGHEVMVVDNLSMGTAENIPGVPLVVADILDDGLDQILKDFQTEAVLHLAAKVSIRGSVENFAADARENFLGTACVLEAAAKANIRRFVMASSMAIYSDSPTAQPIDEDWPKQPLSPYGISKLAAEQLVHLAGRQSGMETLALRFFNTFGLGQTLTPYVGVITIFIDRIASGQAPTIFGDGRQCRDFVYVGDISNACRLAMESSASGLSINIGSGKGTTVNDVAQLLLDRNLATHLYFTRELKPRVMELAEQARSRDYFDPVWMSSAYAVRKMDAIAQDLGAGLQGRPGYYYKDNSGKAHHQQVQIGRGW